MPLFYKYLSLISVLFLIGCQEKTQEIKVEPKKEIQHAPSVDLQSRWIDSVFNSLSDQEKAAQLLWVEGEWSEEFNKAWRNFSPGSVTLEIGTDKIKDFHKLTVNGSKPLLQIKNWHNVLYKNRSQFRRHEFALISDTNYLLELSHITAKLLACNQISVLQLPKDTTQRYFLKNLSDQLIAQGIHVLDSGALGSDSSKLFTGFYLDTNVFENGQVILNGSTLTNLNFEKWIQQLKTSDFVYAAIDHDSLTLLQSQLYSESNIANMIPDFEIKVRKVLALKEEQSIKEANHLNPKVLQKAHQYLMDEHTVSIIENRQNQLPLSDWNRGKFLFLKMGENSLRFFKAGLDNYARIDYNISNPNSFNTDTSYKHNPLIVAINYPIPTEDAQVLKDKIKLYSTEQPIIVVNFQYIQNIYALRGIDNLIHVPSQRRNHQNQAAEAIFGGINVSGKIPNFEFLTTSKTRLSFSIPEVVGIDRDSIPILDYIARQAIFNGATPGCQVFASKNGRVICNKSYGYHTYDQSFPVQNSDVYDIASVTKILGTTLMGMHLKDLNKYQVQDSIRNYLPDSLRSYLGHPSRLRNISFKELYTHTSGMPMGLPIYKFIAYVDSVIGRFDRYYCDESSSDFCVEVAKDFYMDSAYLDSLWLNMHRIWPGEKKYVYSDANMNMLYHLFRRMTPGTRSYNAYLDSVYYERLNLDRTAFNPIYNLDSNEVNIAPTEYDTYWRYQLLKGFVHDPNAALYGGVAGNAGLFSNAKEIGIIGQMLLQNGKYGGIQFINPQTVQQFSMHQIGSHRGLGFDKPTKSSGNVVARDCPYTSFGHTGFTGICTWIDPENQLVFSFVSNRVHPDPNNKKLIRQGVRRSLHQFFYTQLRHAGTYVNSTEILDVEL